MCTPISSAAPVAGSAKGPQGWFAIDLVAVGYDHPVHASGEHALSLDFVHEAGGPGARVAVELTRDAARTLVRQLQTALDEADAYERSDRRR